MLQLRDAQPVAVRREDYTAPAYWIDTVELVFDLDPAKTRVLNRMRLRRNPDVPVQPLRLDGDELNLARVLVNGQGASFRMESDQLVIDALPDAFELEIFTTCCPVKNTKLMGLFVSEDTFFTQCEAEGFRRITYFLDRPDVMASYEVTLRASKAAYPVLLSNGNLVDQGELPEGRHFAKWVDPFRKPAYLFALVAGKLVAREQRITARNGREHLLQVFVRAGDLDKTEHAMNSLIRSVAWDEARFGLPLDLDRFMIVATSDFNMGAMENKGLNIFNTKYVLANQATATDADYSNIESVVGHEYFHNWSGDRVTCRDWFQLSLKEGLTVFRDQEFSQDLCADASARAVKRIEDVRVLRTAQFPEDAGPMAHPVRPDSYIEISNFYTVTIYEKGAEVVRMMQTLVGRKGFERGITLYFERHDGQAVTCDDFAQAIADANPESDLARLLPQFKRWYSQAGTPRLAARGTYDAAARTYTLAFAQSCPPTPGQATKEPVVLPVSVGLLGADGRELALQRDGESSATQGTRLLVLTQPSEEVTFVNVDSEPVPSILRGFSAPVILDFDYSDAQLLTLLANDPDPFNRWEAGQRLALRSAIQLITTNIDVAGAAVLDDAYLAAMRSVLRDPALDSAFKELVLTLPSETYMAEQLDVVDPQRVHGVRVSSGHPLAAQALVRFHAIFKDEALVIDKWFSLQAGSPDRGGNVLPLVKQLMKHPDFSIKNPNRARSVIFSYCSANPGAFHRADAAGYVWWSDRVIELDAINPQVAARLARALDRWSKLAEPYRSAAREAIARVAAKPDLSKDTHEVVTRALAV
ncbi:MAG: aminopeptidase N [Hyphomicrobiales bacterium]|nr:MAG: aminopeptidase N [Hyphomicrobiales bacterium]